MAVAQSNSATGNANAYSPPSGNAIILLWQAVDCLLNSSDSNVVYCE